MLATDWGPEAWARQEELQPAIDALAEHERSLRRRGRRREADKLDRRDAANREARTPEQQAAHDQALADLEHFRATGETAEQRQARETAATSTRTPDEAEPPLSAQPSEPLPAGSGFFEQDTVLDGSLGTVDQDIANAEAQANQPSPSPPPVAAYIMPEGEYSVGTQTSGGALGSISARIGERVEEKRRLDAANAARLAQAQADQDDQGLTAANRPIWAGASPTLTARPQPPSITTSTTRTTPR